MNLFLMLIYSIRNDAVAAKKSLEEKGLSATLSESKEAILNGLSYAVSNGVITDAEFYSSVLAVGLLMLGSPTEAAITIGGSAAAKGVGKAIGAMADDLLVTISKIDNFFGAGIFDDFKILVTKNDL